MLLLRILFAYLKPGGDVFIETKPGPWELPGAIALERAEKELARERGRHA